MQIKTCGLHIVLVKPSIHTSTFVDEKSKEKEKRREDTVVRLRTVVESHCAGSERTSCESAKSMCIVAHSSNLRA